MLADLSLIQCLVLFFFPRSLLFARKILGTNTSSYATSTMFLFHDRPQQALAVLLTLLALSNAVLAVGYLSVDWSDNIYGPDGPWNAITIGVGGIQNTTPIASQLTWVDVLPGSAWVTVIPTTESCSSLSAVSAQKRCGRGGTWNPSDETDIYVSAVLDDHAANTSSSDADIYNIFRQAITLKTAQGRQTVYNASLAAMNTVTISYPNGVVGGLELGFLALNSGIKTDTYQTFSTDASSNNNSISPIEAWIYAGYMYTDNIIASYSFGLHIGSATLNYPGSLVFGGYDAGRIIGPYTTFNGDINLLNMSIGVEVGGSPFSFDVPQEGLLITNASEHASVAVNIDPQAPYIYLPANTCAAIAALLPVYFDTDTHYYLWNTSDPTYSTIVKSPAYLGFTFPPAAGSSDDDNVIIKVPLILLNLTLTTPIVTAPVQYFPCQPFIPNAGENYVLGRAFLQSAFLGRNSAATISWLGQAPGPGQGNDGLGLTLVEIEDKDTALNPVVSEDRYVSSWAPFWTELATTTNASNSTTPTNGSNSTTALSPTPSPTPEKLSGGAIAGIAIGAIAGIALIAALAWFLWRKGKRSAAAKPQPLVSEQEIDQDEIPTKVPGQESAVPLPAWKTAPPQIPSEQHPSPPDYLNGTGRFAEMPGHVDPRELDTDPR